MRPVTAILPQVPATRIEKEKRRAYDQRVQEIECGTLTPFFSQPQGAWAQLPKCSTED